MWSDITMLNSVIDECFAKKKKITPLQLNHLLFLALCAQATLFGVIPSHGQWRKEPQGVINCVWRGKFAHTNMKIVDRFIPDSSGDKKVLRNTNFQACVAFVVEKYADMPEYLLTSKIVSDPAFLEHRGEFFDDEYFFLKFTLF